MLCAALLAGCTGEKTGSFTPATSGNVSAATPADAALPTAQPSASAVPTALPAPTETPAATALPTEAPTAVPTPAPTAIPAIVPTPVPTMIPTPIPTAVPARPFVSKNPQPATVVEGGTCTFEAGYVNAIWAVWHFVSPDGFTDIAYDQIGNWFPGMQVINGMYSNMELRNVPLTANGWKVYCRYTNNAGYTNTSSAAITVIAAAPAPTAGPVPGTFPVSGSYVDSIAGRASMEITGTPSLYSVTIIWPNNYAESSSWTFSGFFDASGVMRYSNGVMVTTTFDGSGGSSIVTKYTNGSGTLSYYPATDTLGWNDGRGSSGTFVRSTVPVPAVTPAINEWTETTDLNAAISNSGVNFNPPIPEALPEGLSLTTYRSRPGIIEARYGNGALVVRKSNTVSGSDLSGDYNTYTRDWNITLKGLSVHCRGNGTNANEVTFSAGGTYYSLSYHPGVEGLGLTANEINGLVNGMS